MLSWCKRACFEDDGVHYLRVPVRDEQGADLLTHLGDAVDFIDSALAAGGVVLVHCKHGQSRSASVVAAWLMKANGWNPQQSLAHLKHCRPRVSPNCGFLRQLELFYESLS
ncbi:unnamed protein product [Polarella glacialis]|uniref:Protein-tyrosine-phosphatase n=1 Tax=Polarella glacialis TaxID=89957 RepID=A0A813EBU6_POLGL|nr:unnamed protein product [Polarella glacialis]